METHNTDIAFIGGGVIWAPRSSSKVPGGASVLQETENAVRGLRSAYAR